jgi:predicted aconitase
MTVALDDRDRKLLAGVAGDGAALAMRLVVRAAEALDAARLIPITRAHVDSCLYHGQASLDFVRRLVDGGGQVSVPTTLNVGAVDLLHPEMWRGD